MTGRWVVERPRGGRFEGLMSSPLGHPLFARGSALFIGLLAAAGVVMLAAGGWLVRWLGGPLFTRLAKPLVGI
jgi:hypothetical protein